MKLNFAIMESTEMPEFLHRGSMDDGDCEPTALRAISDDESLTAEASNKDISLKKNAFEQKRGINVIVHADENNSDSDMSASNLSPHSEVVNGVSELSKDEISEEETKDAHFNMEPRNGVNKDEDSIDEFGDVGTEFSSQDFVPKTLGLKDEFSESEDGSGCGGGGDNSSYTALKSTVSDGTTNICLNEDSSNPKTNVIQEIGEANESEHMEEKCSGEASKSEFDNNDDDDDCVVVDDENSDWQGRSTADKTSKLSIVEDYLSDENSSDKEVSKVFSEDESGGGKLADRQFKEISSETSSEGETAKGDARTDAKFKEIEKDISSEDEEAMLEGKQLKEISSEDEEAMLEGKQLKEISEDNSSEDETVVGDSLGDEFYGTEKCNSSSEHHKDEISEDESIKSNVEERVREDSLERKTVSYDDMQRSSAEECEKTDASDDESDGDSSEYSSPQEEDSCNFDEHLKHSGDDHMSSSDSESFDKGSVGDYEEKSTHSNDFKHKKQECSLSSDRHKYKDVRQNKDETFSEYSFEDNVTNTSSDDVKSHKYLSQDGSCEINDVETEVNKNECERTELKDIQTSVAAENVSADLASTDNIKEEIKSHERSTFQTHTEKTDCSSNVENEGNVNDVDMPLDNKDVKCEISEDESSEAAPNISQERKTELHGESVLEPEDKEEAVTLNEERNLEIESTENLLKENICDNSFTRKPENVNDTSQDSCEEKPLQQEETSIKLGDVSCPSKDNSADHEDLKHEDNTNNSDSEENNSLGKDTDGNGGSLSCVFNVSNDDRNTNSPCQILQDQEQKDLSMESVNLSTVSQDNQSDDGSSSHVPVEIMKNVTQKDDPFSSGDESMENNESDNSVKDLVSLDEGSADLNECEHERKTEADVETNDNLLKSQKQTERDAIQEHPEECETSQSLLRVESKESDTGSRETTIEEADFEGTINAAQSDLQMESLGTESSRTISLEDNAAGSLSCEQRASSVTDKERVCVEDNVDDVSDGHQILPMTNLVVSELKDKADVGKIDSGNSAGHESSETGESEADSSKRTSLESDTPENDFAYSTGHVSCERDRSEADKSNRSLFRSDDPENVPEVVPANTNERSLEHFDSDTLDHLDNDVTVNDRKFSSDDTKLMDSKQEEEKGAGEGEEGEEEEGVGVGRGGEKEKEEEEEEAQEEAEAAPAAAAAATPLKEEEEKETHEETKIVSTHQECDSASNSPSRNSVQELVQKSSSPDTSEDNSPSEERIPCIGIPKDSAHETSEFQVELNEKESTNVNRQISQDTNSYSATEGLGNVDIHQNCSKDEETDHIGDNSSVNIGNGIDKSPEIAASEHSTGLPAISDDVGIQSENSETSTKTELPLTNGTDYHQKLEDDAMETDDLKDRFTEEEKSDQGNTVNDIQIVKRVSIMGNLTRNDCVSNRDQGNNDSRKRKLSSSPEDEPISKEGCSPQFKGFKKRILAQASLEVADEQMHHQHHTLPKPEELQPDLADSYTAPLTEYAQYLGLQPIVKFKCYLCGETGFPSILYLQEHQSSCLKTSKTRPVSQQPAVADMVATEGADAPEGDCPAVGVATATPPAPADISGTPSTNFRITRKVYLCSVCGTYYENWNLFLHMKEMHRRFICLFCLTMFTDAGMLATHLSGEHSVTDRLYDTQEGFREEIADEACFLVCCDCERIFAHTDNFYEHECPTAPSVKKHLPHQQPQQEPKQLQKQRRQQQKQKQVEQSNQHVQGVCSLCGLRGAHFPTCRRASSNSNALTTLVDSSGAVTELSPPDGEQQSEKQPVAKTDTIKKRSGKGKATTKAVPSGDMDAEVDGDEDYDISHAASFCQINIHETLADKPKASDQSSLTPVPKVTIKTKNIPTTVLSDNSATKKNFVTVVKQEPDSPEIQNELDQTPSAMLESQKPKQTTESSKVASIKSGKRGASCSPVPTTEGKKQKFDQLNDPVKTSVEDTEERRGQTSSPVPESDTSSSHSQDSDRLHINTQESESVDGQSCADEDDAAVNDAVKDSEATDADKTEETTTPEKQVSPASAEAQHPKHRMSESESESSGSANDIPSHKTEDSSSSSEAEGEAEAVSSNEDRKQDTPPEDAVKQKSEEMSDEGGGTAEEPESGGEESSKDSPALVVDEEAADDKKDNESGSSQPTTIAEGGEIQVAGDDVPALELTLEEQPEVMTLQALVKECVRVSCNSCVFCNHAKKIAVNGSQLALHLLAEHRFEPVVCTDTADLKPVPADGFTARLKEAVHNLREAFFNTDSYDSTAEASEAAAAEQGDGSHAYDRSYECFHCHFVTTLHKELYVHNRKMHQKTILLCVMCKSNFYSYSELLCHICPGLYAPDADISFRCCLCTVDKLPSAFRLMVHLRKRHHACDVCLEATGDQQRLSNHVWKHKLHHLCYRCGIAYRNKPDITKHLFWKHGTESVLCKKCLQKKWPHVYHFCIPPTAFNCEECGTSFARAVALKVHRRLHSGDRPYTCEDCPDSFISRKLLARHRRLKHAPPEPLPPVPSSLEKNATTHTDREYPAASETEASSVKGSETDQNNSSLETKMSVSLDKRTDNQMSGDAEKQSDSAVKKNKVMDVYDLPPLNLSSDSDDSDEPDTKDSKTATSPAAAAAASAPEVKDSETEVKPDPPVSDSVVGEEEEPAPVQIIDGIWDNFKNYKASLERKEQEAAAVATGSYSTSHAIEVIMSDHDYCVVSKPSNIGTVDDVGSGDGASLHTAGGLISAEGPVASDKTVEGDKDSGSNTDSSPETMEATDSGSRSKVAAADSVSAVSAITGGLSADPEKQSDTGRAPVVATETAPSVPLGTPPQPSNLSTTTSSKKRTKQARKRQKREGASSSSSSSSSDSDSSSCSCGTNCSCSSSSSSSSGSSSSSSDSDSSTSEGRRRQAARRERRRERARKKAAAAAATAADTVPANSGEAAAEPTSRTPTANSAPVAPCDTERERPDGVIHESDLETDETETDEDFYDQYPQRQANRLLAEKRNRLMLLAAVAPASNGTAQLAQQLQELNQQHQEQQQHQRQEEPQQQQQQQEDQPQTQPVSLHQTMQHVQPHHHVRIRSGTVSGDSRKVRTRKRKRGVPSDARRGSASLAGSGETAVRPLGSLPLTTYRDSSGVVTQTHIPESASVPSAASAVRTTGGSGSEGESKRLSKRRRVPKRFYGDSSDEDGDAPVTPQPKWRKTGSGVGGGGGGAAAAASVASVGTPATPSHVPEPPHLPIRQQVTLPSAAALLSSARSVAAGRRPVETVGHSTSSSSSSSSGSDDADSNYESASDGGVGGGHSGGRIGSSGGVGVGSVTGARTGGSAGAEVDNSGNKSENLYCYCQCPYDEVSEMIACDGKDCQIEWFHFECVGIMVPPKGKWFCPDCRKKSSASRGGEYLLHA